MNIAGTPLNRLAGVSVPGTTPINQSHVYDPLGRRISKTANGVSREYLYDGPQTDAGIHATYATWGATSTPTAIIAQGIAVDRPLARLPLFNNVFQAAVDYHANGTGSVAATTLESGTGGADSVQSFAFFDAWGDNFHSSGSRSSLDPNWQGRERDEAGIYYFRARYYDAGGTGPLGNNTPGIGRFISRDPIGYRGGLNPYAFAGNDPVNNSDPSGLYAKSAVAQSAASYTASYAGNSQGLGQLSSASQSLSSAYQSPSASAASVPAKGGGAVSALASSMQQFNSSINSNYKLSSTVTLESVQNDLDFGLNFVGVGAVGKVAKSVTNVVYQGLDSSNIVRYVGITMRDAAVRFKEHLNSIGTGKELLKYRAIDGAEGLTRPEAKVIEQQLIDQYGLGKSGGQLLNKNNSIAPGKN